MISTSNAYKEAIKKNREFSIHDAYTLSKSSVKIEMETGDFLAYSIDDLVTDDSNNIAIGTAAAKEYKATLDNSDGKFDDVECQVSRSQYTIDGPFILKMFNVGNRIRNGRRSWQIV